METSLVVELDFALLKSLLPRLDAEFAEGFDGIGRVGLEVNSSIYDSIGSYSQYSSQLKTAGKNMSQSIFGCNGSIRRR